jgi:hypothetical protein
LILAFLCLLFCTSSVLAESKGRVVKVLPHFLDLQGRHTLSPSLFERDAYQAYLREHPDKRSTIRINVEWKAKTDPGVELKLKIQLRGMAQGNLPSEQVLELPVSGGSFWTHWASATLTPAQYKECGDLTAWRVTLWAGDTQIGEQKSFLW